MGLLPQEQQDENINVFHESLRFLDTTFKTNY